MVTTSVVVDCVVFGAVGISGGVVSGEVMMVSGGQVGPLA